MISGLEIERLMGKAINIVPFNKEQLNPNSYNLTLDRFLFMYDDPIIDMKNENKWHEICIPDEGYVLLPNKLYLGTTVESTETSPGGKPSEEGKLYVPMISGRSSVGRLGINVHATAGFGDCGFCGNFTLELSVVQPVRIYPFCEIAQIYYEELIGEVEPYHGKYQYQDTVKPSMMFKDFEKDSDKGDVKDLERQYNGK